MSTKQIILYTVKALFADFAMFVLIVFALTLAFFGGLYHLYVGDNVAFAAHVAMYILNAYAAYLYFDAPKQTQSR
jgi:hypothetical protein